MRILKRSVAQTPLMIASPAERAPLGPFSVPRCRCLRPSFVYTQENMGVALKRILWGPTKKGFRMRFSSFASAVSQTSRSFGKYSDAVLGSPIPLASLHHPSETKKKISGAGNPGMVIQPCGLGDCKQCCFHWPWSLFHVALSC